MDGVPPLGDTIFILGLDEVELLRKGKGDWTWREYADNFSFSSFSLLSFFVASVASRPGQSGRADGYVLEGQELAFYLRKLKAKRGQ